MKSLQILEELKMTTRYNEEVKKLPFGNIQSKTDVVLSKLSFEFFKSPLTIKRKIFRKESFYMAQVSDPFSTFNNKRGRLIKCVYSEGEYLYQVEFEKGLKALFNGVCLIVTSNQVQNAA